jgi:hypothetical protein
MKKVLLLLAFPLTVFSIGQDKAAGSFMKFLDMEQQHAQDWLNHKEERFNAKMEMLKRHKSQLFNLKKEYAQKLASGVSVEDYFKGMLQAWIELHKQQKDEWKNLCTADHLKGEAVFEKHKAELGAFEKSLGQLGPRTVEQARELLHSKKGYTWDEARELFQSKP